MVVSFVKGVENVGVREFMNMKKRGKEEREKRPGRFEELLGSGKGLACFCPFYSFLSATYNNR